MGCRVSLSVERLAEALRSDAIAPHPAFDTSYYLQQNPDVADAGLPPLEHFLRHGADEGRSPHPDFLPQPAGEVEKGANAKAFVSFAQGIEAPAASPWPEAVETRRGNSQAAGHLQAAAGAQGAGLMSPQRDARGMVGKALRRLARVARPRQVPPPAGGPSPPAGSPAQVASGPRRITGAFDDVRDHVAHGWVFAPDEPDRRLVVEIVDGTTVVGRATADIHRADLERAGISDGRHGFSIPLVRALLDGQSHLLAARVVGRVPQPLDEGKTFHFEHRPLGYDILPDEASTAQVASLAGADPEQYRQALQDVNMLLATGQFENALVRISGLADNFGDGPLLWLKTGEAYLVGKRADRAIEAFDRVLESAGSGVLPAWAWLGRGNAQMALGQWHEARRCYQRANECEPNLAPVMARLAKVDHHERLLEIRRTLSGGDSKAALRAIGPLLLSHPQDPKVQSLAMEAMDARTGDGGLDELDPEAAAAGRAIRLLTLTLAALDQEARP